MLALKDSTEHIDLVIAGFISGGGALRTWNYLSKKLAPLPPNAGWWTTTFYNIVSGTSGHDPANNPPKP